MPQDSPPVDPAKMNPASMDPEVLKDSAPMNPAAANPSSMNPAPMNPATLTPMNSSPLNLWPLNPASFSPAPNSAPFIPLETQYLSAPNSMSMYNGYLDATASSSAYTYQQNGTSGYGQRNPISGSCNSAEMYSSHPPYRNPTPVSYYHEVIYC